MNLDLLELYQRASDWTLTRVAGADTMLDVPTTCPDWDVRQLMNHMIQTQKYFIDAVLGRDATPPTPTPPDLLSDNPLADFNRVRAEALATFGAPGVVDKAGDSIGIAFSDQLLHGWDLAKSTEQDATMPLGLPEAAYGLIHGLFTEDQRKGIFEPEIAIAPGASAQDKFLAYTGRDPMSPR